MTKWLIDAMPFLEKSDYEKVINLYEEIIENQPDEIDNYWYLGLAYLLAGKEEEAQMTWFLVLSQGLEESNQELVTILAEEALNKVKTKEYLLSLKIRETIREIVGEDINNLLHIVNLEILLEEFRIENLTKYNLIELVKNSEPNTLELSLLLATLKGVLKYAWNLSTLFAEAVLIYTRCDPQVISTIRSVVDPIVATGGQILYVIDLLEICNKFNHQDLTILKHLYYYYQSANDFDKSLKMAEELCRKTENYLDLFTTEHLLLNTYLILGKWDLAIALKERQEMFWQEIIKNKEELKKSESRDNFITGIMTFLYFQDNPLVYRKMFNEIGTLFQEVSQLFYKKVTYSIMPTPKKVLKIGYIGHTFRSHSVGYLCRWLMKYHDPNLFDIKLYLTLNRTDEITETWFKPYASQIIAATTYIDDLIQKIKEDEIDILVDLDSATFNLTCIVMSMKPAPIQVTWLGLDASGIPNIDYFMADPYVLPENAQNYYSEKIWRLPHTYLAVDGFEIGNPSLNREKLEIPQDGVIFLNVQSPSKLNPVVMDLQMQILKEVPNSYLVLKMRRDEKHFKEYIYSFLEKYNLTPQRLRFISSDAMVETHRANLAIADVILDTYPYNGATTTLETLWMEIPIVTRVGEQFAARNSYTFMVNAGITEGIAFSDEEYVEWGIKLGTDENLRKEISWKLKQAKKTSPLWNGKQFTREMEKAYQQMWQIYVDKSKGI